ncbi:KRAB-A domain-containing protein 2-like [Penaeus indicus]|uniref:KRAB-A domain-containing protein 2-like n=1 Tax=Penaeus indicus TaxID=29960 RepID=UPI00300C7418
MSPLLVFAQAVLASLPLSPEILEVTVESITVKKLQKKGTQLRFVCAEDVFDVIEAIHRASGHGGRLLSLGKQVKNMPMFQDPKLNYIYSSVDLIDIQSQPDGKHRYILNYQDHLTKMVCLRALQTKTAEEVALHLVDIFCDKGAPHILQSDNGREFSNKGSVERANRHLEAIFACWMKDNNSPQWSQGQKNTRFHSGIGRTPYEAMCG